MSWQDTPISLEDWKQQCYNSSHLRSGETLAFYERGDVVSCHVQISEWHTIFIGAYFIKPSTTGFGNAIKAGTGWVHS